MASPAENGTAPARKCRLCGFPAARLTFVGTVSGSGTWEPTIIAHVCRECEARPIADVLAFIDSPIRQT